MKHLTQGQRYEIYLTISKRLYLHSWIFISDTKRVSKSRCEAPDDAVVIAVPWPQDGACSWPRCSNHVTCPQNEAFPWTKHSNHVSRPRQQSITWPGFFRFDMLCPIYVDDFEVKKRQRDWLKTTITLWELKQARSRLTLFKNLSHLKKQPDGGASSEGAGGMRLRLRLSKRQRHT